MSQIKDLYIRFSPEDVDILHKILCTLKGYTIAKIAASVAGSHGIQNDEHDLMLQINVLIDTFLPPIEQVKLIHNDTAQAKLLKEEFQKELIKVITGNDDPDETISKIAQTLEKYEITGKREPEEDNLPF